MGRRPNKRIFRTVDLNKSIYQLGVCTGKQRWEKEEDAQFEAEIRFIDYYKCSLGNHYHLTSKKESQDDQNNGTKQR